MIITTIFYIFTGTTVEFIALALKAMGFPNIIYQSLLVTAIVFGVSTVLGMQSNKEPQEYPILNSVFVSGIAVAFINLIFKSKFNMFWGWSWINIIIDVVDLIIVSLFIYLDIIEIKQHSKKLIQVNK